MTADWSEVARGAAADAGGLDVTLLGSFLDTVAEVSESGRRLRRAELKGYAERGSAAALAGVPLRALIDLYLSACWRLWSELPAVTSGDADAVRAAGLGVLRAADDGVAALAEGFQHARNDLARSQESARREIIDALLAGGPAAVAVLGRSADLGLDLTSPHAVLVARREDGSFADAAAASIPRRLERALRGRHGDAQPLVAVRDDALICVVAAPDRAAVAFVTDRLTTVLNEVLPGTESAPNWGAAAGRSLRGAEGVRVSYEQALEALDLARVLRLRANVVDAADLVVHRVLLRDRQAAEELVTTVLGPLTAARGGPAVLLETLEAYYEAGGVSTEAARRLHLSVRAVTYRLTRAAELLGRDPTDPAARFELHAAVLAARLLRWPEETLGSG
jgi:sugar diacid utilization regulator